MVDNNDNGPAEAETWKRKYYDALEQHEAHERQWAQADDLLRKTLSRLTLAADGLDDTLDRHLKALRDAIRDRADSRLLRQRIEAMSESLVRLDSKRAAKTPAPSPAAPLQLLLDSLQLPRGHARRVKALRKRIESAQGPDDTGALVADFAALLHEVIAEDARGEAGETATAGGLFGRLFGRSPPPAAPADEPERATSRMAAPPAAATARPAEPAAAPAAVAPRALDAVADALSPAREVLVHLLDGMNGREPQRSAELRVGVQRAGDVAELKRLATALADVFGAVPPPASAQGDAGELLLHLLERLDLPAEFAPRVDAVKARLEDRAGFDVQAVLRDIATLIADMRGRLQAEKQEIEAFLKQLTDRLQDIDSYVRGTETARSESYQSGRELGDAVQAQVRGIEDSVRAAQSLDSLKQAVQQRIDAIITHVDQHRRGEEARNQAVEKQVLSLTERLREMEAESAQLRERIATEHRQALTDALTGIPNRLAYQERIAQEFARWKRFDTPLALLVWDVDRFKQINDQYGHKAGDKVLKVIAGVLAEHIRETDFLARYGGEEFVMIMTGTTQPSIQDVAEKLRHAVEHCGFHYRGENVPITISCGIAEFRSGDTIDAVFERADRALYRAKEAGRNRCLLADAEN